MATDRDSTLDGDQITDRTIKQLELDLTNTPTNEQIVKINMPAGDFTAIDNKPADLNITGQAAEDFLIFTGSIWEAKGGVEKITSGSFTRDTSIGAGTQAVTGVGFRPSALIFFTAITGTEKASWGVDVGSSSVDNNINFRGASFYGVDSTGSIRLIDATTDYGGRITSLDSDGFTITWVVNTGSPTGIADIKFMAYR